MRNELKKLRICVLLLMVGVACFAETPKADFYLSPRGSDIWSGTLMAPNAQGTDGPFATLERARDAVRNLKKSKNGDIVVLIREGTYPLGKTVVFGLEDSGVGDATITYAAYPGETPVFSSGREIKDWKEVSGELPGLPKEARGKVLMADVSDRFFTLYDAQGMLPRASSAGFIPLTGGSRNRLHFPKGKLKNWPNVEDVEIIVRPHHAWISNVLPLASVNEETQMAHTSIDATYAMNKLHFLKTTESCWVENVLEELDEPGEWVLNTQQGKVYLWPRVESPIMAPRLIELIRVEGEIDKQGPKDSPVRNLCFRGLTFMHGDRYTLTPDDAGLQHDWDMLDKANALIRLRGTENCTIEQCHFAHSGSGAIRVDLHGQKNKLSGNHIEHMGGAGILLCGYGPGTKDVNKNNLVYNNHIHHMGRIYLHSPGIMVWQSGENRVANNLIHHMPYCGMILSGCMTHFFERNGRELGRTIRRHEIGDLPRNPTLEDVRAYLHTQNNLFEYNEIHHVMEKMGDGNGIYIRGAGAGNMIRRNYIHHLVTPMLMQAAIRTDGGQRDTLIAENLIYKCMAQGIILKLNNRAENNIVADVLAPPRGYYLSLREGPLTDAVIKRNIFYSTGKESTFIDELPPGNGRETEDRRGRVLARAKDADTDYNIYYHSADPGLAKSMLQKQQGDGVDTHSLAVDPMFVDPVNGDFRFKPESPALKMGIVPFDMSKVGLRKSELGAVSSAQGEGQCIKAGSQDRPNIIFLMTDDQRWDNFGCYGRPEFNTPNIDQLAKEGVLFDKAFYAVAICMPSRVTMMTGRYNSNHRVGFVAPDDYTLSQADFAKSYPAILKKEGYRTGFIGKVGFTVTEEGTRPSTPKEHFYKKHMGDVFDYFAGSETHDRNGIVMWPEDDPKLTETFKKGRKNSGRTLRTGEAMLRFLETQPKDQPFCLSVSFYAVKHDQNRDIYAPHFEQFKDDDLSVPDNWVEDNSNKLPKVVVENARGVRLHAQRSSTPELYQKLVRRFATQGFSVDQQVGLLMETLKQTGILENTIIIYTSDNGRFQGAHGLFDKCLLYEESVKAPLIVYDGRVPESKRGYREDALISSVDMAPTILSLAGLKPPRSMQGNDFSGILNKTQDMKTWRDAVFMEDLFLAAMFSAKNKVNVDEINENLIKANKSYRSHGIRTDRYKYFVYYEQSPKIEELYDLEKDPLEQNNLANQPEFVKILKKLRKRTEELYLNAVQ